MVSRLISTLVWVSTTQLDFERKKSMTNDTLTGLSVEEAEELHRNLIQGTQFFGMIAALAHLLAYIYSPWLK